MCARARSDEGFAMIVVMGAIALITVVGIAGWTLSSNTLQEATRVGFENRAYQAASSGLEQEMAVFRRSNLQVGQSPSGYAYGSWQTINGTDRFRVTVTDLGDEEYEIVSVGVSRDSSETVRLRFSSFNLWDMNISNGTDSIMGAKSGFNGNGRIVGKVYSGANFDWSGNGSIEGGPVFCRGIFNKQSSGSNVGLSTDPVKTYFDNAPTGKTSGMYTIESGSAPVLDIPFPTAADMDNWKQMSIDDAAENLLGTNGSDAVKHPGAASNANYAVFNNSVELGGANFGKAGAIARNADGTINEAVSGDVVAVSGNTLYLNGVVYCDNVLTIDSSITRYVGKGVLVGKNGVVIEGRFVPAAFDSGSFDPYDGVNMPKTTTSDCAGIVSMGDVTQEASQWVCGAVFTGGAYIAEPTGAMFRGSMIVNKIEFGQPNVWLVTQPGLADNLPEGMPDLANFNARGDWIRE